MPRKTNKISEAQILEIIIKRISGKSQMEVAKDFDVSPQAIQYYEAKQETQELKSIALRNAAEVAGKVLGELTLGSTLTTSAVPRER